MYVNDSGPDLNLTGVLNRSTRRNVYSIGQYKDAYGMVNTSSLR